jgi:hypothetical protein
MHVACCTLHACCMLYNARCMLYNACCMLYNACMLHVVQCMHVACCTMHVACCTMHACCMLYNARCMLHLAQRPGRDELGPVCHGSVHVQPPWQPHLGWVLPHLHRDWADPCHICTGATLWSRQESHTHTDKFEAGHIDEFNVVAVDVGDLALIHIGMGSPLPHLHRDRAHPRRIWRLLGSWSCT